MKNLFIESRKKLSLNGEKFRELLANLPNPIYIVYSIQYKELAEKLRNELKKSKIKVIGFSQILGCSKIKTSADILLIGEARFHALNLAISSNKEVLIFDNYSITKIGSADIESSKKREKGKYLRFLSSKNIGIMVSTKPGQENLSLALKLKKDMEKKGKSPFIFLSDNLNILELDNFSPDIWINTACPGLSLDSPRIINYSSLL
jgi:diphthamide biosynthesis enzyme Dph1/Dph2-like protein